MASGIRDRLEHDLDQVLDEDEVAQRPAVADKTDRRTGKRLPGEGVEDAITPHCQLMWAIRVRDPENDVG